ncbi:MULTISPECIES: MipA/OmpV family protein [Leclercia]|uniref:MipA/OmpV family protein n=1 Tax=Leclercia tamurae TaxID=2926467 RepID=A0ABT2RGY4_9ENTR|nr:MULTISPECIES: MipA/OmpV family protein [unclassified Leclercia]MCT9843359.1 MipA/OmpV family protein [Leclercia adecarboxylata ATCC 23216 = NBRC 102595]MCU6680134.1 MipA/OmpV family protein [Leclercia tamurae]PSS49793.1 MltA-interacting protein MipA [Enterobacter sp. FS01]
MTKLKLLALGIIVATSVSTAYAENQWSVGAGVGVINSPYKQYDRDIYPVPVITYEGDNFWFRGLGGGYYLWNDQTDKLSIMAYYDPTHFKPGDSDNYQLRQLDKRKSTMMAGVSWVHNTEYGFLRTALAGDTLDNSNGYIWDLAWLYRYTNGGLTLTPGIGVEYHSDNYNDYYYGVSHKESRRSGLNSYDADDGWNPYLELTASYKFAPDWNVYATGRYNRLSDEVKDSPMVDKSWTGLMSVGLTYSF